jgi:ribosome-binding protein aMBF1 (putative translation factor)
MEPPSHLVTDEEVAARFDAVVEELIREKGVTREELERLMSERALPCNPIRPLGLAIKAERQAKQMSRRQLARRAGVSLSFLTALERGVLPDLALSAFFNIAYALGVSPEIFARAMDDAAAVDED